MKSKKKENEFLKDSQGITYKHPERTCKECLKYPCFEGIENMICDFAKYGCQQYESPTWKTNNI